MSSTTQAGGYVTAALGKWHNTPADETTIASPFENWPTGLGLKATLAVEHRIAHYFRSRPGKRAVVLRALATWAVLVGSKFLVLEAVDIVFGDDVDLGGLVPFIVLVIALFAGETILTRSNEALARPSTGRLPP